MTPFGKYFLLEQLNASAMAEVYKAKTVGIEGFEKIVAIKRIKPAADEGFIKLFVDEAKITSQLSHANLAQTFDLGRTDEGVWYVAMEYVQGKDLQAIFETGKRMPPQLAAWVMSRALDGLDYAHRKRDPSGRELNIVHRDVSLKNIILSYDGEVKLIDFALSRSGQGKPGDLHAAGVVLYELCTGQRLGLAGPEGLEKLPPKLSRVIVKALSQESARYQTAEEMSVDLTRYLLEGTAVTRDDAAAFLREAFPEAVSEPSEPEPEGAKPLPVARALLEVPDRDEGVVGADDPDRTQKGFAPDDPKAEIIVRSKLVSAPPKPAALPAPVLPMPVVSSPPRPVSLEEAEAAERRSFTAMMQRQKQAPRKSGLWKYGALGAGLVLLAGIALLLWPAAAQRRQKPKLPPIEVALPVEQQAAGDPNRISVASSPSGAQVWVDGIQRGLTPLVLPALDPLTAHAVSVEKKCYRGWQVAVPPNPGRRELAASLLASCLGTRPEKAGMQVAPGEDPLLGFLNLESKPAAQVLIDGVDLGQTTPLQGFPLQAGAHQVSLVKGSQSASMSLTIRAGETHFESVALAAAAKKARRR